MYKRQSIYRLYNAMDRVRCVQFDAGHNYNEDSREAVYEWFGRWLLGTAEGEKLRGRPFEVEKPEDLLVFSDEPKPADALDAQGVTDYLVKNARRQLEELKPRDRGSFERFRDVMGKALQHALSAKFPSKSDLRFELTGATRRDGYTVERVLLGRKDKGERIPAVAFVPWDPEGPATLVVHPSGKAVLADLGRAEPGPLVSGLLGRGHIVLAIDPFLTGEYNSPFGPARRDESVRFFTTFNRTHTAERVQDILTALAYLKSMDGVEEVNLVGLEEAGLWCLLARGVADGVARTAVDVSKFDADEDEEWLDRLYIPCIRRAGDFRTAGALAAPNPLLIHNTGGRFKTDWIADVYRAMGAEEALTVRRERMSEGEIVEWIA